MICPLPRTSSIDEGRLPVKHTTWGLLALALLLGGVRQARADLIWDASPQATAATVTGPWSNSQLGQSFAEQIEFTTSMQVTGMDIYSQVSLRLGTSVTIRLLSNSAGQPGALISSLTESISAVDHDGSGSSTALRIHADFTTPLDLSAGTTYWIGMTGTLTTDIGQAGLKGPNAPNNARMAQFDAGTFSLFTSSTFVGSMAFRLEGSEQVSIVPAPSSLVLCGTTFFTLLGYFGWRRRKPVVT